MSQQFIFNHQFNLINKQIEKVKYAINSLPDKNVIDAVKFGFESTILSLFPDITNEQKELLVSFKHLRTDREFDGYRNCLSEYLLLFPSITEKQIAKLFPKIKKLKVPDLTTLNYKNITYLGWRDLASNKLFLIYYLNNKIIGIEGKLSPTSHHSICSFCNSGGSPEKVGFVSVICKSTGSYSSDYYKSLGNYMCLDSTFCNKHITDVRPLERFISGVHS